MGISVKSRSRNPGTERTSISIRKDDFRKARVACDSFGCTPYFAIVADTNDVIRLFLMPMNHLLRVCPPRATGSHWCMTREALDGYEKDARIKRFEFRLAPVRWWP